MIHSLTEPQYDLACGRLEFLIQELSQQQAWSGELSACILQFNFPGSTSARVQLSRWLFSLEEFARGYIAIYDREVYACEATEECFRWFSLCHSLSYILEAPSFYRYDFDSVKAVKSLVYVAFVAGWTTELCTEDQGFRVLLDHDDRLYVVSKTKGLCDETRSFIASAGGALIGSRFAKPNS